MLDGALGQRDSVAASGSAPRRGGAVSGLPRSRVTLVLVLLLLLVLVMWLLTR